MPGGHTLRYIKRLQAQLLRAVSKLGDLNIPVAIVLYVENKVHVEGTEKLKQFLRNIDENDVENVIKEEIFNFAGHGPSQPQVDVEADGERRDQSGPEKLPYPLSALNRKEK